MNKQNENDLLNENDLKEETTKVNEENKKNINFKKINNKKLVELIYEMRQEIVRQKVQLDKLEKENISLEQSVQKKENQRRKTVDDLRFVARKLSSAYREEMVSDSEKVSNYSGEKICDMILKDYLKEKKEYQERILELENREIQYSILLRDITNQQLKIVSYKNNEQLAVNDAIIDAKKNLSLDVLNAKKTNDLKENKTKVIYDRPNNNTKESNHSNEEFVSDSNFRKVANALTSPESTHAGITTVNFTEIKSKIKEPEMYFLKIIGEKGISLYPEIESIMTTELGFTSSKISSIYNNLRTLKVIDVLDGENAVKTFSIKNGVRVVWINKEVGVPVYIDLFKTKPVKSEKEKLIEENDNLSHGYSIKETAQVLKELGYLNVCMDRKENTIKLDSNKLWIPDIIADDPVSKKRVYFEVEYGNHTQEEFEKKLTKANTKASTLRIITNAVLNKTKLIRKVETWLSQKESGTTSMTISVGTFDELKSYKSWGREFK